MTTMTAEWTVTAVEWGTRKERVAQLAVATRAPEVRDPYSGDVEREAYDLTEDDQQAEAIRRALEGWYGEGIVTRGDSARPDAVLVYAARGGTLVREACLWSLCAERAA